MSDYRIELRPGARMALLGLAKPVRRRLQRAIDSLADHPWPADVVELTGQLGALWLQVGSHRVVYTAGEQGLVILVIDEDPRTASSR